MAARPAHTHAADQLRRQIRQQLEQVRTDLHHHAHDTRQLLKTWRSSLQNAAKQRQQQARLDHQQRAQAVRELRASLQQQLETFRAGWTRTTNTFRNDLTDQTRRIADDINRQLEDAESLRIDQFSELADRLADFRSSVSRNVTDLLTSARDLRVAADRTRQEQTTPDTPTTSNTVTAQASAEAAPRTKRSRRRKTRKPATSLDTAAATQPEAGPGVPPPQIKSADFSDA